LSDDVREVAGAFRNVSGSVDFDIEEAFLAEAVDAQAVDAGVDHLGQFVLHVLESAVGELALENAILDAFPVVAKKVVNAGAAGVIGDVIRNECKDHRGVKAV
jgi:hypothetical protein